MSVKTGTRLGPYEILSSIGAGGMGEVYRARDTRLDRIVAVKILPEHFAGRSNLRERFEREAKTIASLNHPHICTLYDIGHQDNIDFLVMEYLEGETLAQRLKKGPLPLDQVLRYGIEIADALDKAHRKGITHRDLKPGNIMLTKSGAKLLDFGLAKLRQEVAPPTPFSELPTANDAVTAQGTILGTLQYMAPEQVEGKTDEIDARTDIFAFGVVVYEMAIGKKAFEGKTSASVMAKILEAEPPSMALLQPMTPPALDHVVKKCLAKEPEERWQNAKDLTDELQWVAEGGSQASVLAHVATGRKVSMSNPLLAWAVAAFFLFASLGLAGFVYFPRPKEEAASIRFFVSPPDGWSFAKLLGTSVTSGAVAPLAVSPDGHRIAFIATSSDGKSFIWVRSLDVLTAQMLAGTEGASSPFWSPDSRFLGFFAGGKLKKIDVSGGPPITLCDASDNRGGTWGQSGVIVFSSQVSTPLQRVSASGGVPTAVTVLGQGENRNQRPSFLPDGKHFLFSATPASATGGPIYLASLDSPNRKLLLNTDSANVVYTQGHLLFLRETTLMAQQFDVRRLELTGEPFPIAEQIQTTQAIGQPYGFFTASENGVVAYQTGTGTAGSQLVWFDRSGKQISVLGDSAVYSDLELSPDGKQVSVNIPKQAGQGSDLWLYDVTRGVRTRVSFGLANETRLIWSPEGSHIVFNRNNKGHLDLYEKPSSGTGPEELLLEDNLLKFPQSWSRDGRFIIYLSVGSPTGFDLWVLPLFGDRKPFPFLNTQFNELPGQFSPDGKWVTYFSNESGKDEVYVVPFPGPGGKWQISATGGQLPRWRRDGTEIFYIANDNKLMAATVDGKGPRFEVGDVKPLFETRMTGSGWRYDVSADGQRFLVNTASEQPAFTPITVVLNWTAGLKK